MTNTKWLRRALLGGVALGVMATGAHADDLANLKAELEALQSRVNQLEQQPTMAALPEGASYITINRGSAGIKTHLDGVGLINNTPEDRGFTIAITPAADLPAPVSELVISGFVKADFVYTIDNDVGNTLNLGNLFSRESADLPNDHFRAYAYHSRFAIRSRTDTAIGTIRTMVEGDWGGTAVDPYLFRLRHAFGEWDMTPNWTLLAGQTTRTAHVRTFGVTLNDFGGTAGAGLGDRVNLIRMTYHAGPISWAVAAEHPSYVSEASWPDLGAYVQFDAPGGHEFFLSGAVADRDREDLFEDTAETLFLRRTPGGVGWYVGAGANFRIMDVATLTAMAQYGDNGLHCTYINNAHRGGSGCAAGVDAFHGGIGGGFIDFYGNEGYSFAVGLQFNVTDTTTVNLQYGYARVDNLLRRGDFVDADFRPTRSVDFQTLHGNIMWQPVRQLRLGWEVMWGETHIRGGDSVYDDDGTLFDRGNRTKDTLRTHFGAWFFF